MEQAKRLASGLARASASAAGRAGRASASGADQAGRHAARRARAIDWLRVWSVAAAIAKWSYRQWCKPRIRTVTLGVAAIALAALLVRHSAWTPVLWLVGVLMVLVAWMGSRLEGRFVVAWGESETELRLTARFKSRPAEVPVPAPAFSALEAGRPQTIAIPVSELKALVAAAETDSRPEQANDAEADDVVSHPPEGAVDARQYG